MAQHAFRIFALSIAIVVGLAANKAHADGSGQFSGASGHDARGAVTVTKNGDGSATVTFAGNFWFDGAPDPFVGFGNSGKYTKGTDVSVLRANSGAQSYTVPASINVSDYNELYIWCKRFAVPLAVARLQ